MKISRHRHVWILSVLFTSLALAPFQGLAATLPSDVSTLLAFKRAVGNPFGLDSWKSSSDPCNDWLGITCLKDSSGQDRVSVLFLPNVTLTGQLPAVLGNLTALRHLDLSLNKDLTGPIPTTFANLVNLQYLNLQSCSLNGTLPGELAQLTQLQYLLIGYNQFSGSIPAAWSAMGAMFYFSVINNQLSGPIPVSPGITNWKNAAHLHLSNNRFTTIPPELGTLDHLVHLMLDNNAVTGPIPPELGNCTALEILLLSNNSLEGRIPKELSQLTYLDQLLLSNCSLSGEIPDLAPLVELSILDLSKNQLSGPLPPAIGRELRQLMSINLGYNSLNGSLPISLTRLSYLEFLNADNNQLKGSVPDLSHLRLLSEVSLANNELTGPVPAEFVQIQPALLSISGNPLCFHPLTAPLQVACKLPLTATPLPWTATSFCPSLTCGRNQAANPFLYYKGGGVCKCGKPLSMTIMLSAPAFFSFTNSVALQLRTAFLQKLPSLSLQQVWIPSSNYSLGNGQMVILQVFSTSGKAWPPDTSLKLVDEISSQDLQLGKGFGPFSIQGVPNCMDKQRTRLSNLAVVGIVLGAASGVAVIAGLLLLRQRQKLARARSKLESQQFSSTGTAGFKEADLAGLNLKGVRVFGLEEIEIATSNFEILLGEGGYGTVYKGTLENGKEVAIKRAKPDSHQGGAEFRNEIELLSGVRHRNLVVLLGFCKERGEQMLIYEYIPHGNLHDRLHGKESAVNPLTWNQRIHIALGSARGIAYLHNDINPPIIHRDIKSSNILVDDKLGAKVADFGLSKLAPETDDVRQGVDTRVKGTLGYVDPEYFLTDRLTHKSDVYSFGVVLLEILTGKRPIMKNEHIIRVVNAEMQMGGVEPVVDPTVGEYNLECAQDLARLALGCVHEIPDRRPTMAEVCANLETIRMRTGGSLMSPRTSMAAGHSWGTPSYMHGLDSSETLGSPASGWSSITESRTGSIGVPGLSVLPEQWTPELESNYKSDMRQRLISLE